MDLTSIDRGIRDALALTCTGVAARPAPPGWVRVVGHEGCAWGLPVTDLLCGTMRSRDGDACGSCGTGRDGMAARLASNMIRVAAQRIFADPEQSVLELPTNSLDAHAELRGLPVTGKFGAGFFSVLFWLFEPGNEEAWRRSVTVTTTTEREGTVRFVLRRRDPHGVLWVDRRDDYDGPPQPTGSTVRVHCNGEQARFSGPQLEKMQQYLHRLRFAVVSRVVLNGAVVNAGMAVPADSPDVVVTLTPDGFGVTDRGGGMTWETALRQLLVPFRSSKTPAPPPDAAPPEDVVTGFYARPGGGARAVVAVGSVVVVEAPFLVDPALASLEPGCDVVFWAPGGTPVPVSRDDVMSVRDLVPALATLFAMATDAAAGAQRLVVLQGAVRALVAYRAGPSGELEDALTGLVQKLKEQAGVVLVPPDGWRLFGRLRPVAAASGLRLVPVGGPTAVAAPQRLREWAERTGRLAAVAHLQATLVHCTVVAVPELAGMTGDTGGLDGVLFLDPASAPGPGDAAGLMAWAMAVVSRFPASGAWLASDADPEGAEDPDLAAVTLQPLSTGWKWRWRGSTHPELLRRAFSARCLVPLQCALNLGDAMAAKGTSIGKAVGLLGYYYDVLYVGVRQEQRALIDVPALTRAAERVLVAMRAACRAFLAAVDRKPYASKWETTHMSVYGMWNSDIDGAFVHCDRDHADVEADVRRGLEMLGQDLDAFSLTCAAVDWEVCGPLMDDTSDLALPHLERDPYPVRCDAMPNLHAALDAVRDCLLPRYAAPSAYPDRLALVCAVREALGNSWTTKPRSDKTTRPVPSKEAIREAFSVLQDQYASGRITGRQEVARALGSGWLARMGVNSARFRGLAATFAAALGDTAGMLGAEPIVPAVPAVHAPARLPLSVVVRRVFDMDTARLLAGSGGLAWMAPPDGDGHGHGPARSTALSVAINEGTTRDPVAAAVTELFQNAVDATRGAPNEADRGVVHIDMAVHGGFVEVAVSNPGTMAPENLLALSVPFLSTKDPAAVAAAASAGEMGSGFFTVYRPPMAHVRISSGRVVIEDTPVRDAQDRAVDVDRVWAQTTGAGDGWTRVGLLLPRSEASRFAPPVHALVTQRLAVLCPRLRLNGRLLRTDKEWGVDVVRVAGDAEIAALYAVLPVANMAMLPSHVFTREVPLRPLDWLLDGLRLDGQDEDGVPPWVRSLLAQGVAVELASGAFEPVQTRSKARLRERTAAFVARTLLHADALHALLGILHRRGLHPEGFPNAQSSIGIYQVLPHLIAERPHPARLASYASESDFWFNYRPSGATRSVSALLHELVPLRTAQWAERVRLAGLDPNVTQAITDWLEPKLDQETEARMESRASGAREAEVPRPVLPESASVQERADADAAWVRSVAAVRSAEIACLQAYVDVLWPLLFTPEERAVVPADAPRVVGLVPPDISALAQAAYRSDDRTVMVNLKTQAWPPRIARAMESGVFDAGFRSALMFGPPAKWIGTHPDATIRHELEHARHHALFVAGRTGFASLDHMAAHPPDFVAQLDARFERILGETSFLTDVHRAMLAAVRAH